MVCCKHCAAKCDFIHVSQGIQSYISLNKYFASVSHCHLQKFGKLLSITSTTKLQAQR